MPGAGPPTSGSGRAARDPPELWRGSRSSPAMGFHGAAGAISALGLAHERYARRLLVRRPRARGTGCAKVFGSWRGGEPSRVDDRQPVRLGSGDHAALTRADGSHPRRATGLPTGRWPSRGGASPNAGEREVYTGEIGRASPGERVPRVGADLGKPTSRHTPRGADAAAARPRPVGHRDQPAAVGGWPDARGHAFGELVRRGSLGWRDVIEVQRQVLTYRSARSTTSPADLGRTATACSRTSATPAWPG